MKILGLETQEGKSVNVLYLCSLLDLPLLCI